VHLHEATSFLKLTSQAISSCISVVFARKCNVCLPLSVRRNARTECHNPELWAATLNWRAIKPAASPTALSRKSKARSAWTRRPAASEGLPFSRAGSTRLRHTPMPIRSCGTKAPGRSRCFRSAAAFCQYAYCGTPTSAAGRHVSDRSPVRPPATAPSGLASPTTHPRLGRPHGSWKSSGMSRMQDTLSTPPR